METKELTTSPADLTTAANLLAAGEVVAFPTETVYGLGADATNETAVKKVFAAKGRPADNPLIMTFGRADQLADYVQVNDWAKLLIKNFWPGPLTMILPVQPGAVSPLVTGGLATAAVRLPDNEATRTMITELGRPIVGPSANTSGKPSPTTAAHVAHDLNGKIAAIVDDGPTQVGVESTVIDLTVDQPTILRTGAIGQSQLALALSEKVLDATKPTSLADDQRPKAPGMKYRHYAPDKTVIAFDPLDFQALLGRLKAGDAVMANRDLLVDLPEQISSWSLGDDWRSASEQLFAGLRYFDDDPTVEQIYVQQMPDFDIGKAYNNRLQKASSGLHFRP
ncbi:L-threonylcarbamoyladenylate synthase [Leuconostocaceae bacterium ESL0958]|nr:L-threonylcarbamoyladenylate synthase [Leuconostocaceae bacterium ESL0958]